VVDAAGGPLHGILMRYTVDRPELPSLLLFEDWRDLCSRDHFGNAAIISPDFRLSVCPEGGKKATMP
jgi:hypothetical protein